MAQDRHPCDPKPALLASTCTPFALTPGLHHAPISYDITFTPSTRTVVNRMVHSLLPAVTLALPVVVIALVGSPATLFLGKDGKKQKVKMLAAVMNLDVLYTVLSTLMTFVMLEELHPLGEGTRAQCHQKML